MELYISNNLKAPFGISVKSGVVRLCIPVVGKGVACHTQ